MAATATEARRQRQGNQEPPPQWPAEWQCLQALKVSADRGPAAANDCTDQRTLTLQAKNLFNATGSIFDSLAGNATGSTFDTLAGNKVRALTPSEAEWDWDEIHTHNPNPSSGSTAGRARPSSTPQVTDMTDQPGELTTSSDGSMSPWARSGFPSRALTSAQRAEEDVAAAVEGQRRKEFFQEQQRRAQARLRQGTRNVQEDTYMGHPPYGRSDDSDEMLW